MATILDTLITDRTQDDVDRVYELRKKFPNWTSAERAEWFGGLRGSYNASDLNRVGEACKYLYEYFKELGYDVSGYTEPKTDWQVSDVPTQAQINAYLANVRVFRSAVSSSIPMPHDMDGFTYEDANNIEKILIEAKETIGNIAATWVYCGIPFCGEVPMIPAGKENPVANVTAVAVPYAASPLTYNGATQRPNFTGYNTKLMTLAGTDAAQDAGTYTVTFDLKNKNDYCWSDGTFGAKTVSWTIDKARPGAEFAFGIFPMAVGDTVQVTIPYNGDGQLTVSTTEHLRAVVSGHTVTFTALKAADHGAGISYYIKPTNNYTAAAAAATGGTIYETRELTLPTQSGTLTYSGSNQSPTWDGYDADKMTIGGTQSRVGAGTYTVTFTPNEGFTWKDGTTGAREASWSIAKADPNLTVTPETFKVEVGDTATLSISRAGTGTLSVETNRDGIVTANLSGTTITVTGVSAGGVNIAVSVAESPNYLAASVVARIAVGSGVLIYYGTAMPLSVARSAAAETETDDYAVFLGGRIGAESYTDAIDAYNASLTRVTPGVTSVASSGAEAEFAGSDYFIRAGGLVGTNYSCTNAADAYDAKTLTRLTVSPLYRNVFNALHVSVGKYAVFAGGQTSLGTQSNSVTAYDDTLARIHVSDISVGRSTGGHATIGGYGLVCGGKRSNEGGSGGVTSVVDAFSESLTRSNPTGLSVGRSFIGSAMAGHYAVFAGGRPSSNATSDAVDAYDSRLTRQIAPPKLSEPRSNPSGASLEDYAVFAVGLTAEGGASDAVDAYNGSLTRTVSSTSFRRGETFSATVGDYLLVAGGREYNQDGQYYDTVDVYTIS